MTASKDVAHVFDKAKELLDEKEKIYGDAWKSCSMDTSMNETFQKANYIRVQRKSRQVNTKELLEDLLDLINRCAFSYYHIEEETNRK